MKTSLKDQLLMAVLGFALGAAVTLGYGRMPHRHGRPSTDVLLQKFNRQLGLSPEQQKSIRATLDESGARLAALHDETEAKLKEIRMADRAEIRKVLDQDQQKRFDEMAARWDARHRQEER